MIPFNFIEVLKDTVGASIEEKTKQLGLGMAKDWADYQERVGYISGLKDLDRIINELTEDKKVT